MKKSYEVVVIGGGIQGLSTAYHLAKRGQRDVILLEKAHIGVGASGRNGEMVRSNFGLKELIQLQNRSLKLWENLAHELDYNVMFSRHGLMSLASKPEMWSDFSDRVNLQQSLGLKSKLLSATEVCDMIPAINPDHVYGAIFQPEAGTSRHDATIWGYAKAAKRLGVTICEHTEVIDLLTEKDAIVGVKTSAGTINTRTVVNAAGVADRRIAKMAGVTINCSPWRDECMVTEPLKAFLPVAISAPGHWSYMHQSIRGEFVGGSQWPEMVPIKSSRLSLPALRNISRNLTTLFPGLSGARLMRGWAGAMSKSDDKAPILGPAEEIEGFILNCGWAGYGYMGGPVGGDVISEWMTTGVVPMEMKPFSPDRFRKGKLIKDPSTIGSVKLNEPDK